MEKLAQQEDQFAELEDRLDHPPLTWAPKGLVDGIDAGLQYAEPKVAGTVEQVDVWQSDYGPYPVCDLRLKDGTRVRVHGFSTVLKRRLGEIDPQVGELIGISYLGEVPSRVKGRSAYSNFSVVRAGGGQSRSLRQFATAIEEDSTGPSVTDDLGGEKLESELAEGGEW
jgi:hypothetical protein